MANSTVQVTIYRQNPFVDEQPEPHYYQVSLEERTTALHLLAVIFEQFEPALAYRRCHCYRGVCGACLLNVNGRNLRACNVLVQPGDTITLAPARGYPLVRDLVVDTSAPTEDAQLDNDIGAGVS